ncbi:MAG: PD-(D/E)XK nuclease domain-containing protein, partial [Lachnospiraceae bacterium]|nr:PD-(D/E)XK nuclease domain-containing protein [Lachnospiraceae bacterium]
GIIIEFKVFDPKKEDTLEETAKRALEQIETMRYETDLKARGIRTVRKYGFAFRGKEVLILRAEDEEMNAEEFNAAAVAYSREHPFC